MSNRPPQRIDASFLTSAPSLDECPDEDQPEIAFTGRSNAGKSSVLNQLTGNKHLARASKTPGRTRLLNYFTTDLGGRLVDLPGYGFADASHEERRAWQRHVERYLENREALCALILVMDCRHPFQPFDQQMIEWTRVAQLPTLVLLNKIDKLAQSARIKAQRDAVARLDGHGAAEPLLFSATSGSGREAAIAWIRARLREGLVDFDARS